MSSDDAIDFAGEPGGSTAASEPAWKVLIADENPDQHMAVRIALKGATIAGRSLQFCDAYDSEQACRIAREHGDLAVVLMDVGMGSECAGLEAAAFIRDRLGKRVSIVLWTGDLEPALQPGALQQLDLCDCWQKTELTARRLAVVLQAAIGRLPGQVPTANPRDVKTGTFRCLPMAQAA